MKLREPKLPKLNDLDKMSLQQQITQMPHVYPSRLGAFHQMRTRHVVVSPDMARHWLANQHPNRRPSAQVVSGYADDMRSGNWSPCAAYIMVDDSHSDPRRCRLISGQHTLSAIVDLNKPMPVLLYYAVRHSEVAPCEGTGRPQRHYELIYRTAGVAQDDLSCMVGQTITALHQRGRRTSGRSAWIDPEAGAEFMAQNQQCLEAACSAMRGSTKFVNRSPVRAANARAWHYAPRPEWFGATAEIAGKPNVPDSRYMIFGALQTSIKLLQGTCSAHSGVVYYYATLYAWAVYLGMLPCSAAISTKAAMDVILGKKSAPKYKAGTSAGDRLPKLQEDASLRTAQLPSKEFVASACALTNMFKLPNIDWHDERVQQWLDARFPWPKSLTTGALVV